MSHPSAFPPSSSAPFSPRDPRACAKRRVGCVRVVASLALLAMVSAPGEAAGRLQRFLTLAGLALTGSADGSASAARFFFPQGLTVDTAGNVYVSDTSNHTIRKITPAGTVTTLAGLAGNFGSTDGTGSAARFKSPLGVAADSAGNLYVADSSNNTIRKITPAGTVSTLAGLAGIAGSTDGIGAAARFSGPRGVAVDTAGNLYVSDFGNNTIRKITPAGVVTTLAGLPDSFGGTDGTGSAARFSGPKDVAVDEAGTVYVADMLNGTIRKITPAGVVTTLAGLAGTYGSQDGLGSAARFDFPAGLAVDSAGNIYVADSNNYTIRKITPVGAVTTLAGLAGTQGSTDGTGSAALFSRPLDVAVDSAGRLYVADYSNSSIRSITPAGVVTTLAGPSGSTGSADGPGLAARFSLPQGVAVDAAGNTYVADTVNNTIRKITPAGIVSTLAGLAGAQGSTDGTGSAARFDSPYGVAVDTAGNVYVADISNSTIRKITPAGVVTTLAGLAGSAGSADGTGSAARFDLPASVAVDAAGTVYVADFSNSIIRKITPAGVVTTLAGLAHNYGHADGTGSAARFQGPLGIAVDTAGILYVADSENYTIRKITPAGVVSTLAGLAETSGSADGTGSVARFSFPQGVAVDTAGNVYVADRSGGTIRKITPAAVVSTLAGLVGIRDSMDGTGSVARFSVPSGIAVDSAGNLYIADTGNNTIRKAITTVAQRVTIDFDGDSRSDLAVFRPASGTWYAVPSATGPTAGTSTSFGLSGDRPVPGDYDGDGRSDLAFYRPTTGAWQIQLSSTGAVVSYSLGRASDIPVPGDYDGDGLTDAALYRPSDGVWSILTSSSNYTAFMTFQWGLNRDVPVPGDYDGDGTTDLAVFRPSNGTWYIKQSSSGFATSVSLQWGLRGDIPVPGDYDGDGLTDFAVYRPANGTWYLRKSGTASSASFQWGLPTDVPAPGDYDADGITDLAVFRPSTGIWYVRLSTTSYTSSVTFQWGLSTDIVVPNATVASAISMPRRSIANLSRLADLDGDARADVMVFRPSAGTWFDLRSSTNFTTFATFQWGLSGDVPVSNDYDGDGTTDLAVYRPSSGTWFIELSSTSFTSSIALQWGLSGDVPVPGDYDGDGKADIAVYRPSSGTWFIKQSSTNFATSATFQWGLGGDVAVPGDYDGDGVTDLAVWRPSPGTWFIRLSSTGYATSVSLHLGLPGDIAVPGDFDGDAQTDLAVFRPSTGAWLILQSTTGYATSVTVQWGLVADVPVPGDFDGDGKADVAVYRPSSSTWFLLLSSSNFTASASYQLGLSGDIPILRRP